MKALLRCGLGRAVVVVVAGLLAVGAGTLRAATIHVSPSGDDTRDGLNWPTAKRTVQAALNAAVSGDQVWVRAGIYREGIVLKAGVGLYGGFAGDETDLGQRNWSTNVTALDGGGPVVTALQGATAATRIDGFTIRNGKGSYGSGGGIVCNGSSPTIANNTITGNKADANGAGIWCSSSSPIITGNTIFGNDAVNGGGIYCEVESSPVITNNMITANQAQSAGGGIYCSYSSARIVNNKITGNFSSMGFGGGIACQGGDPLTIANNTVEGNYAAYGGAGIYCDSSWPTIANNAIVGNSVFDGDGGGIWCSGAMISNNTITGNTVFGGEGGAIYSDSEPATTNTIIAFNSSGVAYGYASFASPLQFNCVFGNEEYDFFRQPGPGSRDNISADPRFVQMPGPGPDGYWGTGDDVGDLHLLPGSPCIDAGDNAYVAADAADLDGDGGTTEPLPIDLAGAARFANDPYAADTGSGAVPLVDIGAYEHRCGDVDGDGLVDVVDLLGVVYAFGTLQGEAAYDATCDFNADGAVDVIDLLDIVYNFSQ